MLDIKSLKYKIEKATKKIKKETNNVKINSIIESLVSELVDAEFASIWFYDNAELVRERDKNHVRKISMDKKHGVLYKCFKEKTHGIYNHIVSEKDYVASIDNPDKIKIKAKIILPLINNNKLIGMLTAYNSVRKKDVFTEEALELLKAISPYIIDTVYQMHPNAKPNIEQKDDRRKNSLKRAEVDTINKVKKIDDEIAKIAPNDKNISFMAGEINDMQITANALSNLFDIIQEQINNPELSKYILKIKENSDFINNLTTSTLNQIYSKQNKKELKKDKINSIKYFSNVAEIFSASMYSKKIIYNIFIDPLIPKEILTNPTELKSTIMNLISNAYKFTPTNNSVKFSARYKDKKLFISVKNRGIGISKEKEKEILTIFKQIQGGTILNHNGNNLGLSKSANNVKNMDGLITLKNNPNKGSEFIFSIPVDAVKNKISFEPIKNKIIKVVILLANSNNIDANNIATYLVKMGLDEKQIVAINSPDSYPKDMTHLISFQTNIDTFKLPNNARCLILHEKIFSSQIDSLKQNCKIISKYEYYGNKLYDFISYIYKTKILVVDDDKTTIASIKSSFEAELYDISIAMNGENALSSLINAQETENPFSILYLDSNTPVINGFDVIRKFREFEKDKQLKPIFAVLISENMVKEKGDKKHFNAFMNKPFNEEEIRETLSNIKT